MINLIGLASATDWRGPYTTTSDLQWPGRKAVLPYIGLHWAGPFTFTGGGCEDPTLFAGRDGSVHMLVHKYEDDAAPGWPGLHAFSPDGSPWLLAGVELARRERGLLLQRQLEGRRAHCLPAEGAAAAGDKPGDGRPDAAGDGPGVPPALASHEARRAHGVLVHARAEHPGGTASTRLAV